MYKTVLLPLRVPAGNYCWEFFGEHSICPLFSNIDGIPVCGASLGNLEYTDDGVPKPEECSIPEEDE